MRICQFYFIFWDSHTFNVSCCEELSSTYPSHALPHRQTCNVDDLYQASCVHEQKAQGLHVVQECTREERGERFGYFLELASCIRYAILTHARYISPEISNAGCSKNSRIFGTWGRNRCRLCLTPLLNSSRSHVLLMQWASLDPRLSFLNRD